MVDEEREDVDDEGAVDWVDIVRFFFFFFFGESW